MNEAVSPRGRAWIELSRENLAKNVSVLRSLLPDDCALMPAVKANAYGHGAVQIAQMLSACGVNAFCVACAAEGAELREYGITGEILILGYTHPDDFPLLVQHNLTQAAVDCTYAKCLSRFGCRLRVHLAIDTGMHRLGADAQSIVEILDVFRLPNLDITGVFTHLSADNSIAAPERAFTRAQADAFSSAVAQIEAHGFSCEKKHLLASYGVLNYPWLGGDYARTGIALYGVLSRRCDLKSCPIFLSPVLSLKARVAAVKMLPKGAPVGYGLDSAVETDRKIAVLSVGYADGLPRSLSDGRGGVLIAGQRAPIVGKICMDQTIVDVTGIPVQPGDEAVLIGRSGGLSISVYDIAEKDSSITNEVLSRLGARLVRVIVP